MSLSVYLVAYAVAGALVGLVIVLRRLDPTRPWSAWEEPLGWRGAAVVVALCVTLWPVAVVGRLTRNLWDRP